MINATMEILTSVKEPKDPTNFNQGDIVYYESDKNTRLMVVGESDTYLHTFFISGKSNYIGSYYGVFKKKENLESLTVEQLEGK